MHYTKSTHVGDNAIDSFHPGYFVKHCITKNAERDMSYANLPDLGDLLQ